jgi:hypothetical protein
MSNRSLATLGASALITGWIAAGPATAAETAVGPSARSDLAVTVYGNGLGLIADRRRVVLSKGSNSLGVEGLSPALIADSLLATFDKGARVTSITQNRQRARQRDIMRENIGKAAHLVRVHPQTGADVLIPATLLGVDGGVIARIGDKVVLNPEGRWAFDGLPAGFTPNPATPSLTLGASADEDGPRALDLRYLSDGLKWHPAYTAEWSDADGTLSLKAWAVIDNTTGSDFDGAWLKLVAGQVNRQSAPQPPRPMARAMKAEGAMLAADAGAPAREAFGGYHLYSLPMTVDLADGASQQVPLMAEIRIKAERKLISEGYPQAFGSARGSADPTHPRVTLDFTAPAGQGAQPLPAGTVRLYAKDRAGIAQFLGEDRLGDTPRGGKASLDAGRAFDVTVARAQTSFNRESRQVFESGHRLTLHNGGTRPAMVEVVEVIPGDWTILDSDRAHERTDGRARWTIEVAAGADAVLNYRVQVRN